MFMIKFQARKQAKMLGAIITNPQRDGNCFWSGKPGHMKRDCRQPRGNRPPVKPGLCPKCGKRNHWANECRFCRDITGQPFSQDAQPKNGKWGPAPRAPPQEQSIRGAVQQSPILRASPGSAGLYLYSSSHMVLTPDMGPQICETTFSGPLPPNTVGLVIGHSSKTLKGLMVHPGVIDADFTGNVKVIVSSPKGITIIVPGKKVAQLLVLPSCHAR